MLTIIFTKNLWKHTPGPFQSYRRQPPTGIHPRFWWQQHISYLRSICQVTWVMARKPWQIVWWLNATFNPVVFPSWRFRRVDLDVLGWTDSGVEQRGEPIKPIEQKRSEKLLKVSGGRSKVEYTFSKYSSNEPFSSLFFEWTYVGLKRLNRFKHDSTGKDDWDIDACSLLKSRKTCDHKVAHLMSIVWKIQGQSDQTLFLLGLLVHREFPKNISRPGPP